MLDLLLAAGCAARLTLPVGLPEPAEAWTTSGRDDLAPGYRIGPYRVERPTGGWAVVPSPTGGGLRAEGVGFGFDLAGPGGTTLLARCESTEERPPGPVGITVLDDTLRCTAEGLVLRLTRSGGVRGELALDGRSLTLEPVRQPGGLVGSMVAGVAVHEGDRLLAAIDLLGSGVVHVGAGVGQAERERIALVAAALFAWPPPR